jgi:GNAT superfamily N-acetyltransferase
MTFELLPPSEWGQLKEVFVRDFGTDETPDPETAEVYALREGGEVVCFFLLERVLHAGPFWVRERDRGKGLGRKMAEAAMRIAGDREGYIAATVPEAERLAESLGMVRIKGSLWCKEAGNVR